MTAKKETKSTAKNVKAAAKVREKHPKKGAKEAKTGKGAPKEKKDKAAEKGKAGTKAAGAAEVTDEKKVKAGELAEAKGPTTRMGIISEFFRKLLLPIVLRFNNAWNWMFAKECTWRQVVILTILFFVVFQFLYNFCLYDLGILLKNSSSLRKLERKWNRTVGRCFSFCKSVVCFPFVFRRGPKSNIYHHILFLPCDVEGPRGLINPGHKLISTCISEARESIDGCLFMITHPDLVCLLVDAQMRGVSVRIIMDHEMLCNACRDDVEKLKASGVQIFAKISPFLMHHKFIIVDKTVLVNGSFNWSRQGLQGNHENLMITNNPVMVVPYHKEFTRLRNEVASQVTEKLAAGDGIADDRTQCYL